MVVGSIPTGTKNLFFATLIKFKKKGRYESIDWKAYDHIRLPFSLLDI